LRGAMSFRRSRATTPWQPPPAARYIDIPNRLVASFAPQRNGTPAQPISGADGAGSSEDIGGAGLDR
jgi:hypothetical protein